MRILSRLHGLLRPLDLMQPCRLEMGTSQSTERGDNLYAFWGDKITSAINADESEVLVNLASNEYFSAVKPKQLKAKVITPVFKDEKNAKVKIISFYAKKPVVSWRAGLWKTVSLTLVNCLILRLPAIALHQSNPMPTC